MGSGGGWRGVGSGGSLPSRHPPPPHSHFTTAASPTPSLPPSPLGATQAQKVYVQDRLAQSADLVWGLLQGGAHFYVCGDAGSMAGAVEAVLLRIIEGGQGQGPQAAQRYLDDLAAGGRYQRDVWLS